MGNILLWWRWFGCLYKYAAQATCLEVAYIVNKLSWFAHQSRNGWTYEHYAVWFTITDMFQGKQIEAMDGLFANVTLFYLQAW